MKTMHYPTHVAVIPDGNRTRAKENNKSIQEAYLISYQRGVELVQYTFTQTDTKIFTLRWLSTENAQKRPAEEFDFLMAMYTLVDDDLDKILIDNNVNFKRIGNPHGITQDFRAYLEAKVTKCQCDSDKYFIFAINYGGRDEIIRGIQKLATQWVDRHNIDEQTLSQSLELWDIPPVDLVIRTKGDQAQRTSWFMSRWIGYAELYFTPIKCPAFDVSAYKSALERFDTIATERNFGK
jgi:undecaprenyl diphosphate synthase